MHSGIEPTNNLRVQYSTVMVSLNTSNFSSSHMWQVVRERTRSRATGRASRCRVRAPAAAGRGAPPRAPPATQSSRHPSSTSGSQRTPFWGHRRAAGRADPHPRRLQECLHRECDKWRTVTKMHKYRKI